MNDYKQFYEDATELYFKKKCTIPEITKYAYENFGEYSGYAQQYLFYYALNHKHELKEDL